MSYTISRSDDGHYIILKVIGTINRKSAMEQNLKAHALGRELGIRRYFVDLTEAESTESPVEKFNFVNSDMNNTEEIDRTARVSALVRIDDHSHDFMETACRNSGYNLTLFRDEAQAIHHLIRDVEVQPSREALQPRAVIEVGSLVSDSCTCDRPVPA